MRSGTSKGSTISQYGCSTFAALATEAQQKRKERTHHIRVLLYFGDLEISEESTKFSEKYRLRNELTHRLHKKGMKDGRQTGHSTRFYVQGKAIPLQAWTGRPRGFQDVETPRFQDNRHMKVERLSALSTGRLYPSGNIPSTHLCQRLS